MIAQCIGVDDMAAWRELEPRLLAIGATSIYFGNPSRWLLDAARAAKGGAVALNCKGLPADDIPVIVTLAELERLRKLDRWEIVSILNPDLTGVP